MAKSNSTSASSSSGTAYAPSGAGFDAAPGAIRIEGVQDLAARTFSPRVLGSVGGFAALFSLDYPQRLLRLNYQDPVLVSCCHDMGAKLALAIAANRFDAIGIDLVARNVNDLLCTGAEPLFFLHYLTGRQESERTTQILTGISAGCLRAGCAFLGDQAAPKPDQPKAGPFDLTGFAVGVVERRKIIDGSRARPGDAVIALASTGLHADGFEMARRVLLDKAGLKLSDRPGEMEGKTLEEALLEPTALYAKPVLEVLRSYKQRKIVKALAHVTAGGLPAALPRVLGKGLTARIKRSSWKVPGIFQRIAKAGAVDEPEMFRAFNMGIGLVMVVSPGFVDPIMARLRKAAQPCWVVGKIVKGDGDLLWA